MSIRIRAMTMADVEAGLRLTRLAGWNQQARDWQRFVAASDEGGGALCAVDAGTHEVVGSVAAVHYPVCPGPSRRRETAAWVAMVLVAPTHRGGGIGTALLTQGLRLCADARTIGLDATPLGRPLYETMGFAPDAALTRLRRPAELPPPRSLVVEDVTCRRATQADLDAIAHLDADATGLDRSSLLTWLLAGAPDLAWVAERSTKIIGVVAGRDGHTAAHLGPVIADDVTTATRLVEAAVRARRGAPVLIDAMDRQPAWRVALETMGFAAQRPFTRMYLGAVPTPAPSTRLFAIVGPEFG